MTLPPLLEFQKITAEGLRAYENAADNPEGFAMVLAEAVIMNGLEIARSPDASLKSKQEETSASSADTNKTTRKGKTKAEEVDE